MRSLLVLAGLVVASLLVTVRLTGLAAPPVVPIPTIPQVPVVPGTAIEVRGLLLVDEVSGLRHFQVESFALVGMADELLAPLAGQRVIVQGTLYEQASILMRRVVQVLEIRPDESVSVPAQPGYRLLFGRVGPHCDGFYLQERQDGPRLRLLGADLAYLAGQSAAVATEEEISADQVPLYHVLQAIPLGDDITPYLGTIFYRPASPVRVTLHGAPLPLDREPILVNGRALVGVRALADALGATVTWDEASQQVTLQRGELRALLQVGNREISLQETGQGRLILRSEVAPVLASGRLMAPIRTLAEALGLKVDWDPATGTVLLR